MIITVSVKIWSDWVPIKFRKSKTPMDLLPEGKAPAAARPLPRIALLRGCEPIHFGIAEEGTRMTSAGYMISSFDCIAEVVGPQQQQDRIRWSVTLPRGSFRRAGDTLYPSATALAAAARSATARIRLCATANHNNTARTLSRPRSSRRWKPRLRRSALTHSALARWR